MFILGMRVKVFTANMSKRKQHNGKVGTVVGLEPLCMISPQDASLSRSIRVLIDKSTIITIPEGCASRA
jgi:hypothetical protein